MQLHDIKAGDEGRRSLELKGHIAKEANGKFGKVVYSYTTKASPFSHFMCLVQEAGNASTNVYIDFSSIGQFC